MTKIDKEVKSVVGISVSQTKSIWYDISIVLLYAIVFATALALNDLFFQIFKNTANEDNILYRFIYFLVLLVLVIGAVFLVRFLYKL
jgi:hypothetical protein